MRMCPSGHHPAVLVPVAGVARTRRLFALRRRAGRRIRGGMLISPLGDSAVVITLGESIEPAMAARVIAVAAEIARHPPAGVVDVVPAFASIAVFFDPTEAGTFETVRRQVDALVARAEATVVSVDVRTVEIPVCYGGEFGPDLGHVAARAQVTEQEAIALHAGAEYLVHAIGFAPGFPYLGGLPPKLATPRRATPRSRVPAGSVGIGGAQTGIYPLEIPGGWNLIGRTPLSLFDAARVEPALLRAGDKVRFRAIGREEFESSRDTVAADRARQEAPASPDAVAGIEVVRAGMFTTVQDLGRRGHRASGVPLSGAADPFAARLANLLVGNPENAATLEFTLLGPELKFLHDSVIAIAGGEFGDLPHGRPVAVRAGTVVKLDRARRGCRGYLAAAGGIDVAPILGSRSTYVRAALGGFHGRALRDGDVLPVPREIRRFGNHWRIDDRILPEYAAEPVVRVVTGAHAAEFGDTWLEQPFTVSAHSDRMGLRLQGAGLERSSPRELVSSPVAPGTVQVPPDGQPIVLLADAQTIGGYPQIAHVIAVDLPIVAQLRPGDRVRFQYLSLDEAHELVMAQERALGLLREGLAQKLG